MERLSIDQEVHRLFEQMFDAIDKPNIDRDKLRDMTDHLATLTLVQMVPEVDMELRDKGFYPVEAEIMKFMCSRLGKVIPMRTLAECYSRKNRQFEREDPESCVKVHICRIRKHLKRAKLPYRIETVRPGAYRMLAA